MREIKLERELPYGQEKYKEELKIQIEWRQSALDQIDSPLNLSLCFYSVG